VKPVESNVSVPVPLGAGPNKRTRQSREGQAPNQGRPKQKPCNNSEQGEVEQLKLEPHTNWNTFLRQKVKDKTRIKRQ